MMISEASQKALEFVSKLHSALRESGEVTFEEGLNEGVVSSVGEIPGTEKVTLMEALNDAYKTFQKEVSNG